MTTNYVDEKGLKKKFLAPLIVVMLCAVTLTGVAYAYSSSISGNGYIAADYYAIELYRHEPSPNPTPLPSDSIYFNDVETYTEKTLGGDFTAQVIGSVCSCYFYVKVQSNVEETKIFGSAKYTKQPGTADMYDVWNAGGDHPIVCDVMLIDDDGTSHDISETDYFIAKTNHYYTVEVRVWAPSFRVDLGTNDPAEIASMLTFNGSDCISFKFSATGTF